MAQDNQHELQLVDFSGLILGFSSAALYYLGHSPVDGKNIKEINLALALQNIEIVKMLAEKTKGNLSPDEVKLLEQVLKDLSHKYDTAAADFAAASRKAP